MNTKPKYFLNIQSLNIGVVFSDPSNWEPTAMGRSDIKKEQIQINKLLPINTANATVWHEVIHYISDLYNLKLDEKQICGLDTALFSFLRDNPNFIHQIIG